MDVLIWCGILALLLVAQPRAVAAAISTTGDVVVGTADCLFGHGQSSFGCTTVVIGNVDGTLTVDGGTQMSWDGLTIGVAGAPRVVPGPVAKLPIAAVEGLSWRSSVAGEKPDGGLRPGEHGRYDVLDLHTCRGVVGAEEGMDAVAATG